MRSKKTLLAAACFLTAALMSSMSWAQSGDESGDGDPEDPVSLPPVVVTGTYIPPVYIPFDYIPGLGPGGGGGSGPSSPTYDSVESPQPPKPPKDCEKSAYPVVYKSGYKVKTEVDFEAVSQVPLRLERNYSQTSSGRRGLFGFTWFSNLDQSLRFKFVGGGICDALPGQAACVTPATASADIVSVGRLTSDGSQLPYNRNATTGVWESPSKSAAETISRNADGSWKVVHKSGEVENYNAGGFITSTVTANGVTTTYTYSSNYLQSVNHPSGRKISLGWSGLRVSTVTDPAGNIYRYSYAASGYLSQVQHPGTPAVSRTYHYESTPGLLTGISVNGVRYSSSDYYADGRVFHSGLANGVDRDTFTYGTNSDGTAYTQVTNAKGAITKLTFKEVLGEKRLVRMDRSGVANCPNAVSQVVYDANGFKDYEEDFNGNRTDYTYTAKGHLEDMTTGINSAFPGKQRFTDYIWDTVKNRVSGIKTYGATTADPLSEITYEYYGASDPSPNQIKAVSFYNRTANGTPGQLRRTTYTYTVHPSKLIASLVVNGPRTDLTDTTTYTYNTSGDLTSVKDAAGNQVSYASQNGLGLPGQETDENGVVTQILYDARGREKTRTRVLTGGNRATNFEYHPLGGISKVTRPGGSVVVTTYDNAGRVIGENMNGYQEIQYMRDVLGNVHWRRHINSCPTTGVNCSKQLSTTYSHRWEFDELGRLTADVGSNQQRTEYRYDNNGNVKTVRAVDLKNGTSDRTTTLSYGPNDELLSSTDQLNQSTTYTHDGAGRIATVTDPKNLVTRYRYDGLGNLVEVVSPDAGITSWQYDEAGNRKSMTRADGSMVTFAYDALNRLTSASGGGRADTYAFDTCTNGKGRLCRAANESSTDTYTYTQTGLVATQTSVIAGTSYAISRAYDNLDRQITVTYPGGTQVKFEYNDQDQVTAVKSVIGSTTTTLASQFSYLMFGPASKYTLGNGTVRQVSYNLDYRVVANSPNLTYSYNSFNEVSSITDGANSSLSQTFDYDALGRLRTVTSGAGNQAFTFDANGSRETHTWGGVVDDYIPQATTNRIASVTGTRSRAYTFDGRGNTYTESGWRGGYTYAYDPITNRLQTVTKASAVTQYSGNALNQRVRKAGPGGNFNFLFDPSGSLLSETAAGSTAMSTHYVWLGGELLAVIRSGVIYYVLNDQLGRPREVQNSAKTAVWRASNFAYDRSITLNTFGGLNVGLPGQYFDTESGLYYNWNRHYDASTGRYLQSDPIGILGGLNTYTYADGNPVSNIDPLGLWSVTVGGYFGPGIEIMFGSNSGNRFGTVRVGLGFGFGATYDPRGGIPGDAPVDRCKGGVVLADTVSLAGSIGNVAAGGEFGISRNYANESSGLVGGAILGPTWGAQLVGSVGAQATIYNPAYSDCECRQ
ncbi:RHS repeat-associated core domain-containing protein [Solimonas sp. SE-A11]|uniref:RHS repeat-associated core domain-containing protein n=1 Tax=Solimonas sp. SE-A11 TaxID=3054954 RepID=UPI00259CCD5B|nr:RHS repeat-associated core domain-containing protein [Solimonas sp. SE-A11]MDM4770919.1 RHS repeat-associated core domain-containing protein [Solimonas sp. SE-A11]